MEKKGNVDFKVLWDFTKGKRHYVFASIFFSIAASICSFIPYVAIYKVIETLLYSYPELEQINTGELISYGWMAFGGVSANMILYFLALMLSHLAAFGTLYKLKLDFSTHISKVPLGFHSLVGSGKLRKIMDENIEKIEGFIAHQLPDITAAIIAPIISFIILFAVDWRYGIVLTIGIVLSFSIQVSMFSKDGVKEVMKEYESQIEAMNNGAVEYIRGISVIKAFNQTIHSFKSLREIIKKSTESSLEYTLKWKKPMSLFTTLLNNLYLFIIPLGIILTINSENYIDSLTVFIFYLMIVPAISGILTKTMYASANSIRIFSGVERMIEILEKEELTQPKNPKITSKFDIEFKNVDFSYNKDKKVINNISFFSKENTITALVGPSGGGKTTIAHLIPRFFDVDNGEVLIGGVNIKDMTTETLMDKVSFVFQDVYLFKQSIKENIKMDRKDITDEQVYEACKLAMCDEFIMNLQNGYDTVIGKDGVHLSGGEMQRIAIARAIIKDAPIIVLDEATAFADPENEYLIQQGLNRLLKDKTVIIIAHRLYTIKNADNILVIDNGEIKEEGTHLELLKLEKEYYKMWEKYTKFSGWTMGEKRSVKNA